MTANRMKIKEAVKSMRQFLAGNGVKIDRISRMRNGASRQICVLTRDKRMAAIGFELEGLTHGR